MIRLLIPDSGMQKIREQGLRISNAQSLRWTDRSANTGPEGALFYKKSGERLTAEAFLKLRDNFGAVIETTVPAERICRALGLPVEQEGILWVSTKSSKSE